MFPYLKKLYDHVTFYLYLYCNVGHGVRVNAPERDDQAALLIGLLADRRHRRAPTCSVGVEGDRKSVV